MRPFSTRSHLQPTDNSAQYSCQLLTNLSAYAASNLYTIIGEWTTSPTDCAMWLNGRGVGARWDGSIGSGEPVLGSCTGLTGNMSTFSDDYKTFMRQWVSASNNLPGQG